MPYKIEQLETFFLSNPPKPTPAKKTAIKPKPPAGDDAAMEAALQASEAGVGNVEAENDWNIPYIKGALAAIPPDDYNTWVEMAICLKGECNRNDKANEEDALEMWLNWSAESTKFDDTIARKKWEDIPATGEKGISSVFWKARNEHGWTGSKAEEPLLQQKRNHPIQGEEREKSSSDEEVQHSEDDEPKKKFADAIEELNDKNFVVMENGKTCVMSERFDRTLQRHYLSRSSFDDFRNFYCNRNVLIKRKNKKTGQQVNEDKPLGTYWLHSPHRRQYKEIVFQPGMKNTGGAYNLWRGWTVDPEKGDWTFLKQHIHKNICCENQILYEYFLNWMAYAVQYPDKQAGVAIVMKGERGVGKGSAAVYFGELFGQHFIHILNSRQVTGNFNAHLRDAIFLFSDEAVYAGNKMEESTLKGIITESHIPIEAKGRDVLMIKNCLHIMMATNNEWAIPAGFDERRFLVLNVGNVHKQDLPYFGKIQRQMRLEGGKAAMLYELLTRDIGKWNVFDVPKTSGLFEQKVQSLDSIMKWWYQKLMDGYISEGWEWDNPIPCRLLQEDYIDFCHGSGITHRSVQVEVGLRLKKLCPANKFDRIRIALRKLRLPSGAELSGRIWHYQLQPLQGCRDKFEEICHQAINWDEDVVELNGSGKKPVTEGPTDYKDYVSDSNYEKEEGEGASEI